MTEENKYKCSQTVQIIQKYYVHMIVNFTLVFKEHLRLSEGTNADRDYPKHLYCHHHRQCVQFQSYATVMVAMLESTTHKSARHVYTNSGLWSHSI